MATKPEPIRRHDVIRCQQCGEDYSVTYKCCPFCDERPNSPRAGSGGGRRVKQGANPIQVVGLIVSLVVIIAAAFIVFTTVLPLIAGDADDISGAISSVSQSASGSVSAPVGSTSTPDSSVDSSVIVPITVNSITLDESDFTLPAGDSHTLTAVVDPADAPVVWSSSNEQAATVDQSGKVTNVNTSGAQERVTITATAGGKSASCTVYCRSGSTGGGTDTPPPSGSGSVVNKSGEVSGAGGGLNVRTGPGSSYERIASLNNGADVTVLEDCGNGWYKISFSGTGGRETQGYVSKDYIKVN